jgi:hypothetical protein
VTQPSSTALIASKKRQRWRNDKIKTSGMTMKGTAARRLKERQRQRDRRAAGGGGRAATATKRGGQRSRCNDLTITHEERRASGGGR